MTEQVKQFLEKVSADEALIEELAAALEGVENAEQVAVLIEFAKKKGYEFTKEDFAVSDADISLEELEAVTGGGGCGCALGGGGGGDDISCICPINGFGFVFIGGKRAHVSQGACVCPLIGAGATRRH